ncbi:MAG: hypothetical protein ACHP7O_09500 [Burkholderiales bacterium]
MQFSRYQKLCFLFLWLLFLAGCRTVDDFYGEIVGLPISHYESTAGPPARKVQAPNGNEVYEWELKYQNGLPQHCTIFFEVTDQGIIVKFWHKGICESHDF